MEHHYQVCGAILCPYCDKTFTKFSYRHCVIKHYKQLAFEQVKEFPALYN